MKTMNKIRLGLDQLSVESFSTAAPQDVRGTVDAREGLGGAVLDARLRHPAAGADVLLRLHRRRVRAHVRLLNKCGPRGGVPAA